MADRAPFSADGGTNHVTGEPRAPRFPFDDQAFYRARVVARILPVLLPLFEDKAPVDIRRSVMSAPDSFWATIRERVGLRDGYVPSTATKSALIAHLEEAAVREAVGS